MTDKNETIFDMLKNPLSNVEQEYIGPDYEYYKKIKTPTQLGMGSKGTFSQLGKDISGLIKYVEVLVTGRSGAQTKQTPLGDRFFLKTGAQCKDPTGALQHRWIYIDNIPSGDIPIITSALDNNFTDFEGLIPGAISKMNDLNPNHFLTAFVSGSEPPCRNVTLNTVDVNDVSSFDSQFVSDYDISSINPCAFQDRKNPITNKRCREGFQDMTTNVWSNTAPSQTKNSLVNIIDTSYYTSLTALLLFILYRLLTKNKA
jgi:hypothetical protein